MIFKKSAFSGSTVPVAKNLFKTGSSFSVLASYAVFKNFSFSEVILTVKLLAEVKFLMKRCLQNGAYPDLS